MLRCHDDFRARHKVDPNCKGDDCEMEDDLKDPTCKGPNCEPVDPKCAKDAAINDWLEDKMLIAKYLNQQTVANLIPSLVHLNDYG